MKACWRHAAAVLAVLAASHACAGRAVTDHRAVLADVVQSYEREVTPYYPFIASEHGLRQYDRVLANDISEEYRSGLRSICARHREDLRRVDTSTLTEPQRLTYDIFAHHLDGCLESLDLPWHLLPINQAGFSWPSRFPIVGSGKGVHPFKTARNYEDFLGRIDGFVTWVDTAIVNMKTGMERGITYPRDVMLRVVPQLQAQIVTDPRTSVFYDPIRTFPAALDEDTRRRLTETYEDAITRKIVPAYTRLLAFVRDEYLPRCRTSVGFGEMAGSREMYARAVRSSTTTRLTPDAIYDLGVAEVTRIKAEINRVRLQDRPARHQASETRGGRRARAGLRRARLPRRAPQGRRHATQHPRSQDAPLDRPTAAIGIVNIEEHHGFAGVLPSAWGAWGALRGPPSSQAGGCRRTRACVLWLSNAMILHLGGPRRCPRIP